jgi:hypothetical protein
MDRSSQSHRLAFSAEQKKLLSLPELNLCSHPFDYLNGITRAHLELTISSNNEHLALPIEAGPFDELAGEILHQYRERIAEIFGAECHTTLHTHRIVSGIHGVEPQLAFLAEAHTILLNQELKWCCLSPYGAFQYSRGAVATHVQTSARTDEDPDAVRHFSQTPIFTGAAFSEDLDRIVEYGVRSAFQVPNMSYTLILAINKFIEFSSQRQPFELSSLREVNLFKQDQHSALIFISTTNSGQFTAEIQRNKQGVCTASIKKGALELSSSLNGG